MNSAYPLRKQATQTNDDKRRRPIKQVQQSQPSSSSQQGDAVFWAWAAPTSLPERTDKR